MQKSFPGRKRFTPAEKNRILASYRRSRLTQRDFVAHAGISLSALQIWKRQSRKVAESSDPPSFIPVPNILPATRTESFLYRLQFPGNINLEIAHGFASAEVLDLCRLLQNL